MEKEPESFQKLDATKENSIVIQEAPMVVEVPKRKILSDETKIIFSPPAQNLVVAGEHTVSRSR